MKKVFKGLIAMTMALAMTGCGTGSSSGSGEKELSEMKVGVIQLMQHDALDKSYEGFKDVLVDAGIKEENIDYQIAGDQSNCTTVADKLVNGGNDLIYAIATPALQAAASATQDLPIVGCAVTDYESTKLVKSNEIFSSFLTLISCSLFSKKDIFCFIKLLSIFNNLFSCTNTN